MRRASGESSNLSDFAAMLCHLHCVGASTQDAVVPTKQKPACISSRVPAVLLLLRCQSCNLAVFLNHSVCGAMKQQCTSAYQPGIALVNSRSNLSESLSDCIITCCCSLPAHTGTHYPCYAPPHACAQLRCLLYLCPLG